MTLTLSLSKAECVFTIRVVLLSVTQQIRLDVDKTVYLFPLIKHRETLLLLVLPHPYPQQNCVATFDFNTVITVDDKTMKRHI